MTGSIIFGGIVICAIVMLFIGMDWWHPRRMKSPVGELRARTGANFIEVNEEKMNETLILFSYYRCARLVDGNGGRMYHPLIYDQLDRQIQELEAKLVREKILAILDISALIESSKHQVK